MDTKRIRGILARTYQIIEPAITRTFAVVGAVIASVLTFLMVGEALIHGTDGLITIWLRLPIVNTEFHLYSLVIYMWVFTAILVPAWRAKAFFAAFVLWTINENTFDILYSIRYPFSFRATLAMQPDWIFFVVGLFLCGVGCWWVIKPKVVFKWKSFAFPIFLCVWIAFGLPLIEPFYAPNLSVVPLNFFWEIAYQITLIISFVVTIRPRPPK